MPRGFFIFVSLICESLKGRRVESYRNTYYKNRPLNPGVFADLNDSLHISLRC